MNAKKRLEQYIAEHQQWQHDVRNIANTWLAIAHAGELDHRTLSEILEELQYHHDDPERVLDIVGIAIKQAEKYDSRQIIYREIIERIMDHVAPKREPYREALSMTEIATEVAATFQADMFQPANVTVHVQSPVYVYGSRTGIERIFLNLLINGVEALEDDTGDVSLSVGKVSINDPEKIYVKKPELGIDSSTVPKPVIGTLQGGSYAHAVVSDSGNGIPTEKIAQIFTQGYSTKDRSSGVGLASVKRLVLEDDGALSVKSELGKGTHMHVYFPAVPESDLPNPPF